MISRYQQNDIATASPLGLVVKLYQGAIRQALQARDHLVEGRVADRARAIGKALAIVGELQSTLDLEQGGEIARNLDDLYTYVTQRLLEANLSGEASCIDEATDVLRTLLGGWEEIARGPAGGGSGA